MISLHAYQSLADAWDAGTADWCRSASAHVLNGGRAWMIAASEGQANWIKRRLLCEGVSLFGVQFLDARALRRELCLLLGLEPPALGRETLNFLLRAKALAAGETDPEAAAIARHPGACLGALDDLAAAGWLDCSAPPPVLDELMPGFLRDWLPTLRDTGFWTPHIDRQLRLRSERHSRARKRLGASPPSPLAVCVLGWDATRWPLLDLLTAALRAADDARAYIPLPRDTGHALRETWITTLEQLTGVPIDQCPSSGFRSAQAALASRMEGADLDDKPEKPEFLAGENWEDTVALARDFTARWLLTHKEDIRSADSMNHCESARLVILCPRRTAAAVALVRALGEAKIAVEDELGERPEPTLPIQIQRAVLHYHLDGASVEALLSLVELLNEHFSRWAGPASGGGHGGKLLSVCPLDPMEARRALRGAFADFQEHDARTLCADLDLARVPAARPLRDLVAHLGRWPESIPWQEALRRWEDCLEGLGLSAESLEPLWSRLRELPLGEPVPAEAFFHYLGVILNTGRARRAPEGSHRFARVVVTTLDGAAGQIWGGALFLDSNEGAWPLYPAENSFLDDAERRKLNEARTVNALDDSCPDCGHLLTSSDRAQLEQCLFFELLENCAGPLAFAGAARDPADPSKELYPNEWALRCLVESEGAAADDGEKLLDRWRRNVRQTQRAPEKLSSAEQTHLQMVFTGRRDEEAPFDEYCFNFEALTAPDELPFASAWSAKDLDDAWNRPATFALGQIFEAEPFHDGGRALTRAENWVVGRMVHRWVKSALGGGKHAREFASADWQRALTAGLDRAREKTETRLHAALAGGHGRNPPEDATLPRWWQGALRRAAWAAHRCLGSLAQAAADGAPNAGWLSLDRTFAAELSTPAGPVRLQAHCDAVLLDRAELPGAACQMLDIRTGGHGGAAPSPAQMEKGQGLDLAALLFLAEAEGAPRESLRVGNIHPSTAGAATLLAADAVPTLEPILERIALRQRSLVFGQGAMTSGKPGQRDGEDLPMAATPIDSLTLAAKSARTFA